MKVTAEMKAQRVPKTMPPRAAWQIACSAVGEEIEHHKAKAIGVIVKNKPSKDSYWMEAVAHLGYCVNCKKYGVEVAHRNQNKALSQKNSDRLTAALCQKCHHEIDNGKHLSNEERRLTMDRMVLLTFIALDEAGMVEIKIPTYRKLHDPKLNAVNSED